MAACNLAGIGIPAGIAAVPPSCSAGDPARPGEAEALASVCIAVEAGGLPGTAGGQLPLAALPRMKGLPAGGQLTGEGGGGPFGRSLWGPNGSGVEGREQVAVDLSAGSALSMSLESGVGTEGGELDSVSSKPAPGFALGLALRERATAFAAPFFRTSFGPMTAHYGYALEPQACQR